MIKKFFVNSWIFLKIQASRFWSFSYVWTPFDLGYKRNHTSFRSMWRFQAITEFFKVFFVRLFSRLLLLLFPFSQFCFVRPHWVFSTTFHRLSKFIQFKVGSFSGCFMFVTFACFQLSVEFCEKILFFHRWFFLKSKTPTLSSCSIVIGIVRVKALKFATFGDLTLY